jgi:DNA-binding transcriptional ArsR family regulator
MSTLSYSTVGLNTTEQLTATFTALADPTRRAMLARLAKGDASVSELAAPFPITIQAVSKHLRVLEDAGLVERSRSAQLRPARLRRRPLERASRWLEALWEDSFDELDRRLRRG